MFLKNALEKKQFDLYATLAWYICNWVKRKSYVHEKKTHLSDSTIERASILW